MKDFFFFFSDTTLFFVIQSRAYQRDFISLEYIYTYTIINFNYNSHNIDFNYTIECWFSDEMHRVDFSKPYTQCIYTVTITRTSRECCSHDVIIIIIFAKPLGYNDATMQLDFTHVSLSIPHQLTAIGYWYFQRESGTFTSCHLAPPWKRIYMVASLLCTTAILLEWESRQPLSQWPN